MKMVLLADNLGLKLLSLVLAFSLWFLVVGGKRGELQISVPVEAVNISQGLVVARLGHDRVDVTLVGPKILLLKLRHEQFIMPLDVRGLHEGRALFSSLETRLRLPGEVRVTRIQPSTVEVDLARKPHFYN